MAYPQQPGAQAGPSDPPKPPAQIFEFTKRKRWADILLNDLTEAIVLVLSPACKVLFCGNAVTELLGWRDDELIDTNFLDLIHNTDGQASFRECFDESVRTRDKLLAYVRLKTKNRYEAVPNYTTTPTAVLFEVTGYPKYIPDNDDVKCFFATAQPYPSKNVAKLNELLELKIENERLQRLLDLPMGTPNMISPANSIPNPLGESSSMSAHPAIASSSFLPPQQRDASSAYGGYRDTTPTLSRRQSYDLANLSSYGAAFDSVAASPHPPEDDTEDGSKKKKLKKTHVSEQYVCVTCGRTDSPEWRKGPQGPKTLCNACGLRWAKQMRKNDDPSDSGWGPPPTAAPS
ncbi:hypothetical protein PLICRDRAFT_40714 [Plicaturopsis crispa FD-325 SS-3]|nr:hypothetical protein PLICRDRAFT_40714 [Plicaturopsis crispa FD-325 SS-3]